MLPPNLTKYIYINQFLISKNKELELDGFWVLGLVIVEDRFSILVLTLVSGWFYF